MDETLASKLAEARTSEDPPSGLCVEIARLHGELDDLASAYAWLRRAVTQSDDYLDWSAARRVYVELAEMGRPSARRSVKIAIASSHTTTQLAQMLELACLRWHVDAQVHEAPYGQYQQASFDPTHSIHEFEPDLTIVAVHERDVQLPFHSTDPAAAIDAEVERWRQIWHGLQRGDSTVIQFNFATRPDEAFGHLSRRLPGSRSAMLRSLNLQLGEAAGRDGVVMVDCDRVASLYGKARWFDDRYWYLSKQSCSLGATPLLARHTSAVIAAHLGLTKRCAVLDLDGTLWGGTIGEDGLAGIDLGSGPAGEAFSAFQDYLLTLQRRGVILAICSKNNERDALEPFLSHPDMRISVDDVAVFVANWEPKPANLEHIAEQLNLGLDSFVFIDDNPAERELMRELLPEVEVITLPSDPALYARTLDSSLLFEPGTYTEEDTLRTEQYRARAQAAELRTTSTSLEDFLRELEMVAAIKPFDELDLPRVSQLVAKTNQFNVTTRRHSEAALRAFMESPDDEVVHFAARLRDRFADHGVVAVLIAIREGEELTIDTWLMSCRVIGRTLEQAMLRHLVSRASELGCTEITGTFIPTAKNQPVADLFERLGFEQVADGAGATRWRLSTESVVSAGFVIDEEVADAAP